MSHHFRNDVYTLMCLVASWTSVNVCFSGMFSNNSVSYLLWYVPFAFQWFGTNSAAFNTFVTVIITLRHYSDIARVFFCTCPVLPVYNSFEYLVEHDSVEKSYVGNSGWKRQAQYLQMYCSSEWCPATFGYCVQLWY